MPATTPRNAALMANAVEHPPPHPIYHMDRSAPMRFPHRSTWRSVLGSVVGAWPLGARMLVVLLAMTGLLAAGGAARARAAPAPQEVAEAPHSPQRPAYVEGELLVGFRAGTAP